MVMLVSVTCSMKGGQYLLLRTGYKVAIKRTCSMDNDKK